MNVISPRWTTRRFGDRASTVSIACPNGSAERRSISPRTTTTGSSPISTTSTLKYSDESVTAHHPGEVSHLRRLPFQPGGNPSRPSRTAR